jgi:hypothetical protein
MRFLASQGQVITLALVRGQVKTVHPGARRLLFEEALSFFEETFADRIDLGIAKFREFLQFGALRRVEMSGDFDRDAHMEIAPTVTLRVLDSLALDPEHLTRLGPWRDAQKDLRVERWHV